MNTDEVCLFFQSEDFELASSAAYTFLLTHPKHESMIKNVEYYRTLPQVKPEYFIDLQSERKQHLVCTIYYMIFILLTWK